jgi:hypothetical protein
MSATAPSLALLQFARGPEIDLQPGRPHVLLWLGSIEFVKDQNLDAVYRVFEETTEFAAKHLNDVTFVAVVPGSSKKVNVSFVKSWLEKEYIDGERNEVLRTGWPYVTVDNKSSERELYLRAAGSAFSADAVANTIGVTLVDKAGNIAHQEFNDPTKGVASPFTDAVVQKLEALKAEGKSQGGAKRAKAAKD